MGIRFFCPNGHRLHVKSFLAGKRGVCPDCGMGVDIPLKSDERALGKKKAAAESIDPETVAAYSEDDPEIPLPPAQNPVMPAGATKQKAAAVPDSMLPYVPASVTPRPSPVAAKPAPLPQPAPVTPASAVRVVSPIAAPTVVPTSAPQAVVTAPVAPPQPMPAMADPIAEAPMAIWYVRPSSGGQFGPARGEVMLKWLGDGRVTNDSLVWREGWPDWRNAAQVFPNLQAPGANPPAAISVAPEAPRRVLRPARKSSSSFGIAVVVILTLVAVTLAAALIYVVRSRG